MNIQLKPIPKIPKRKSQSLSCLPLPTLKKSRSLESLQTKSQRPTIQSKCNYKLSTEHIHFLMQQQRLKELHTIHQNLSLKQYYQTFNLVFQIIYKTSKMVLTYMYYNRTQELNVDRLQVLNVLMGNLEHRWTVEKIRKLQVLSTNLYELSKDEKDFQRRIEYVGRKLCNNLEKRQQIETAFLNDRLKRFWKSLTDNRQFYERNYFIHDMFSSYAEKLCFLDIQIFISNSLSQEEFKEKIQKYCGKHELDDDLGLSYTFQFLMLEEFSFGKMEEEEEGRRQVNEDKAGCKVM